MYKKILLIKPPEKAQRFNFGTYSLAVLAAAVRHQCDISILDATDLTIEAAGAEAWESRPDLIGVTVMGHESVPYSAEFIRHLHETRPVSMDPHRPALIMAGGHGATTFPENLISAGADAVVLGEGENTLREIVESGFTLGMPGTACFNEPGEVLQGPVRAPIMPLDDLPFPARDLIAPPPDGVYLLETSRGCPHDCAFCASTRFYGRRWRPFSPARVVAEIDSLVNDHDAWIILIADDNFATSPRRVIQICELLAGKELPAIFMVAARGDDLISNPDLLPAMAKANMLRICVGVETLDPETAGNIGKPVPAETYHRVFHRMRELGMFSMASMIVGVPGETEGARKYAVERLVKAGPDSVQFSPYLAIPGTPLSQGFDSIQPRPIDIADAQQFTANFYRHPEVRQRLEISAAGDGMQGILARSILKKYSPKVTLESNGA